MKRILILLAALLSVVTLSLVSAAVRAHTGTVDGGSEFSANDLEWYLDWGSEHDSNRPDWPNVLAIGADVWVAATDRNIYGAKAQAFGTPIKQSNFNF